MIEVFIQADFSVQESNIRTWVTPIFPFFFGCETLELVMKLMKHKQFAKKNVVNPSMYKVSS